MAIAGDEQQKIDSYLDKLRKSLRGVNDNDLREIVEELRSHILDKAAASGEVTSAGVDAALAALGSPEELTSQYITDNLLARAEVSRSPWRILLGIFRWAGLSAVGFFVFLGSVIGYALAGSLMWCAVLKPIYPATVGLWVSNRLGDVEYSLHLGFGVPAAGSREILGWWIIPIGLVGGYALLMLTTRHALWWVRRFRKSRPLPWS